MNESVKTAPVKAGRGLRIALAISVALNLAVAGMVVGAALNHRGMMGGMRGDGVRDLGFGPFTEALRPEDRKALRQAFLERMPQAREARAQVRSDIEGMLAALRADPFDPAALTAIMAAQHSRMAAQLETGQQLLRDLLIAMPAEARHAFADRLEAGLRRGAPDRPPAP